MSDVKAEADGPAGVYFEPRANGAAHDAGEGISLLALSAALLRSRWRIVRWAVALGILAGLSVFWRPQLYQGSASFVPVGGDGSRSGLATLAGQLGVTIPTGGGSGQTNSPVFYAQLLQSRVLLGRVARDTIVMPEMGGRHVPVIALVGPQDGSVREREEQTVSRLKGIVQVTVDKTTNVVTVSAATRWPSASLGIVRALVQGVNDFNQQVMRDQAAAERVFIDSRLDVARAERRAAEDRLEQFLAANRQIGTSPYLAFQRQRLESDLALRQQVYTALMQSFEDAQIREVRNTPVITVIETPAVPTQPLPRGRVKTAILGALAGALIAVLLVITRELLTGRAQGSVEASEFLQAMADARKEMLGRVSWIWPRTARSSAGRD